jgi:hypothetical protein
MLVCAGLTANIAIAADGYWDSELRAWVELRKGKLYYYDKPNKRWVLLKNSSATPENNSPPSSQNQSPNSGSTSGSTSGSIPSAVKRSHFRPGYYMSVGLNGSTSALSDVVGQDHFVGVKVMYRWRDLEPRRGSFNFDLIENDLEYLRSIGKRLWIQVELTKFSRSGQPFVPTYMWNDSSYGCGTQYHGSYARQAQNGGWLACLWNNNVLERYTALMAALGARFNKEAHFEGITLTETAIDVTAARKTKGYSSNAALKAFEQAALKARKSFPDKSVMQMVNFAPYDIGNFVNWLVNNNIGIGGPDLHTAQSNKLSRKLSAIYDLYKKHHNKVPTGPDVQWNNYTTNPGTTADIRKFAVQELNPWYMFWLNRKGWFHKEVVPDTRNNPLPAAQAAYR